MSLSLFYNIKDFDRCHFIINWKRGNYCICSNAIVLAYVIILLLCVNTILNHMYKSKRHTHSRQTKARKKSDRIDAQKH